jgi:hypothetical protein
MTLMNFIFALILVGLLWWLANRYLPATGGRINALVNVVFTLILVGMFLWLINTFVPMAGSIKAILNILVVAATCVWVLQVVGLWSEIVSLWNGFKNHRVPESREQH